MAQLNWRGPELSALVRRALEQRLDAAAIAVEGHAKKLISVDGTTSVAVTRIDKKGRKRKAKVLRYNTNPSKPGEPPHVQTGRLRASVAHEREGLTARVGTNVIYGRHLELGTATMAPRPWLRRALVEMTPAVQAIVGKPIE